MISIIIDIVCILALFGIDQGIKAWATAFLAPVGAMPVLPGIVELRYLLNQGMAFSLLSGKQAFLIVVTGIALVLLAVYLFLRCRGRENWLKQSALVLILAGGIGNLFDRILNGQVVDYINVLFMNFAVFNFADICVCVGTALLILSIFLEEAKHPDNKVEGSSNADTKTAAAQPPQDTPKAE